MTRVTFKRLAAGTFIVLTVGWFAKSSPEIFTWRMTTLATEGTRTTVKVLSKTKSRMQSGQNSLCHQASVTLSVILPRASAASPVSHRL